MKCPKCSSDKNVKDGIVKNKQRYQCKRCSYRYTVEFKAGIEPFYKRLALMMYLEGLGFRPISRIIGVSDVAVLKWIRTCGIRAGEISGKGPEIKEVEMDEMHTYIGAKKTKNGCGSLLINWSEDGYKVYWATERPIREIAFGRK